MTVHNLDIPYDAEPMLIRFANFLAESDELTEEINTSVDIEVRAPHDGNTKSPTSHSQHVFVREHGNDGYELVPIEKDGSINGYRPEGTSAVGKAVQNLADEFFGRQSYSCGFYEDEETSETTITPHGG